MVAAHTLPSRHSHRETCFEKIYCVLKCSYKIRTASVCPYTCKIFLRTARPNVSETFCYSILTLFGLCTFPTVSSDSSSYPITSGTCKQSKIFEEGQHLFVSISVPFLAKSMQDFVTKFISDATWRFETWQDKQTVHFIGFCSSRLLASQ